jgi:hypothetical protein
MDGGVGPHPDPGGSSGMSLWPPSRAVDYIEASALKEELANGGGTGLAGCARARAVWRRASFSCGELGLQPARV